jgi:hypothetical protein
MERKGMERHGKEKTCMEWHGMAWAWHGMAWKGKEMYGMAWHGIY